MNSGLSVWNFDILSSKENKIDNFENMINDFLFFSNRLSVNFFLDLKKTKYSFIEKIIYDTVKFHCNRLNIELTDKVVDRIQRGLDDLIILNFANPDMVGHTGVLAAGSRAVETACKSADERVIGLCCLC
jgi:hypothetical protein